MCHYLSQAPYPNNVSFCPNKHVEHWITLTQSHLPPLSWPWKGFFCFLIAAEHESSLSYTSQCHWQWEGMEGGGVWQHTTFTMYATWRCVCACHMCVESTLDLWSRGIHKHGSSMPFLPYFNFLPGQKWYFEYEMTEWTLYWLLKGVVGVGELPFPIVSAVLR